MTRQIIQEPNGFINKSSGVSIYGKLTTVEEDLDIPSSATIYGLRTSKSVYENYQYVDIKITAYFKDGSQTTWCDVTGITGPDGIGHTPSRTITKVESDNTEKVQARLTIRGSLLNNWTDFCASACIEYSVPVWEDA